MTLEDNLAAFGLPTDLRRRFASLFTPKGYDAGEVIVHQGTPIQHFYFVSRGLIRFFYTRDDGREFNKSFLGEGSMGGALSAYLGDGIAPFGIQALEPTRLWSAPYAHLAALYDEDRRFERMGRQWVERLAVKKERRERALLEQDATTRYLHFLAEYPQLAQRIPLYHIARYIGVTEVSLSRIRARLARSPSSAC
ncbi:MAG: Crp/Fnr family transcriptional regulator [Myxococcota bacterium]